MIQDPGSRNRWKRTGDFIDLIRPTTAAHTVEIDAAPSPVRLDAARVALLVVDMQNDFCTEGGWLHSIGVDVSALGGAIDKLADLIPAARAAGVPVIWVNWGNRPDGANLPPNVVHVYDPELDGSGIGAPMPNGSRVLTKDAWGAAVVDRLQASPTDIAVDKYRMSGFWDTPLDSILRNLRVDTLLFSGVNSDQCVYSTLIDAACLGYDVILVDDASATTSPDYCHKATVYNTRQCFGFTTDAEVVINALKGIEQ